MSSRQRAPFEVVPRIDGELSVDPDRISLKRLRDVVAGRDASFSRAEAIALLLASDFPNKHRDLEAVLANENDPSWIRYVAAMSLGRLDDPRSMDILIRNSVIQDERVLAGVVKALGRIGDKSALDAVVAVKERTGGPVAAMARFAAALIAHRLGLEGHELPLHDDQEYAELVPAASRSIQFSRAHHTDAEFCLRTMANEPLGIEFAERPMYQVRCGRTVWMLLFNREFTGPRAAQRLGRRKALLGVAALRNEADGRYSPGLLIMTSPATAPDGVVIRIHHMSGKPGFGGTAQISGERARFRIRALAHPGARPVDIEGLFEQGQLEIVRAVCGVFVQQVREPIRG